MPHKHTRKNKSDKDYDLPPDTIAKPLSVSKSAPGKTSKPVNKGKAQKAGEPGSNGAAQTAGKKRKRNRPGDDDTPKAFARLMAFQQGVKPKSGLDDGTRQRAPKKQKTKKPANGTDNDAKEVSETVQPEAQNTAMPTILPGERMVDFSARVDAALPLSGLVSKGNVKLDGVKRQRTRIEKKITRMQDEWREREKRYREKQAEAEEDAEIEAILNGDEGAEAKHILEDREQTTISKRKKGKKGKRRKGSDDSDDDPWAAVAKARKAAEKGSTGLIGVHDVVQEPPRFAVQPKEKFKVKEGTVVDVSNVPGAAGSLRRREELGEARKHVLKSYKASIRSQKN